MIIDIKSVMEGAVLSLPFETELDFSDCERFGTKPFDRPVHLKGTAESATGIVTLGYLATFTLTTQCDRCAAPLQKEFKINCTHTVVDMPACEDSGLLPCKDGLINLADLAREDILPELPTVLLCTESCRGICCGCGKNLNESACECQKKIDPRLQKLAELLENNND